MAGFRIVAEIQAVGDVGAAVGDGGGGFDLEFEVSVDGIGRRPEREADVLHLLVGLPFVGLGRDDSDLIRIRTARVSGGVELVDVLSIGGSGGLFLLIIPSVEVLQGFRIWLLL